MKGRLNLIPDKQEHPLTSVKKRKITMGKAACFGVPLEGERKTIKGIKAVFRSSLSRKQQFKFQ
jgi:hypothetical protein